MSAPAPVVSNSGPLIVLAKLNVLHLLKLLYGRVHIPQSVYNEVVVEGMRQGYEDAERLQLFLDQMGWRPEEVELATIPSDLWELALDQGERDTLALAQAIGDALVLMDESVGREAARARGLAARGSLGVLIEAYRRGFIEADQLRLYFEEIAHRRDIWINAELVERLAREVFG
jgi:predicted nucleic acid-binding protein